MLLVIDERAVNEDAIDAYFPELANKDTQVDHEPTPPLDVPVGRSLLTTRPHNEMRSHQFIQRERIITWWEKTTLIKWREFSHLFDYPIA